MGDLESKVWPLLRDLDGATLDVDRLFADKARHAPEVTDVNLLARWVYLPLSIQYKAAAWVLEREEGSSVYEVRTGDSNRSVLATIDLALPKNENPEARHLAALVEALDALGHPLLEESEDAISEYVVNRPLDAVVAILRFSGSRDVDLLVSEYLIAQYGLVTGQFKVDGDTVFGSLPPQLISDGIPHYGISPDIFGTRESPESWGTKWVDKLQIDIDEDRKTGQLRFDRSSASLPNLVADPTSIDKAEAILRVLQTYVVP